MTTLRYMWVLLIVWVMGFLTAMPKAFAYPELVRHGYVNCTACHVAPTGGGVLTPYGRQLSRAVMSTWGYDGEEKPAYFINQPEWLNLGGDYRSAYVYQNTPLVSQGTYQFMQLDLAAAATYKKWTLAASVGYQDPDVAPSWTDYLISRTHYLMYHVTDEVAIRGGRFFPAYGIYTPNHALTIKDQLNIREPEPLGDGETYNLEVSYIGDAFNVIGTGIFGRPDDQSVQRDVGASLQTAYNVTDHSKIGLSYLYGATDYNYRHVVGPYGIIGLTKQLYILTEADFQNFHQKGATGPNPSYWGAVETTRFGYEIVQGLNLMIDQEFARTNFSSVSSLRQRYGVGIWWFPRPHLEAALEYQQRQDRSQPFTDFYDYLYLLWHIYI
jgi:hypothetical protein